MDIKFEVFATERIRFMEKELAAEMAELKLEIEESGILQGGSSRAFSSVSIPRDISYFRKERELVLNKGLQVSEAKPLVIQADVMQRELETCLKREYTADSLPLILHQFFTDRIQHLIQCKYLHMLRWKRFCRHTGVIEKLYPLYKKQIVGIMKEYDDAVQRAQRLSVARECLLTETGNPHKSVTQEDVMIYLQWLVCHLHSVTTIHNYLRILQYLPMIHKLEKAPDTLDAEGKVSSFSLSECPTSSWRMSTRPSTAFSSVSGSAGETSAVALSARTHFVPSFNKCPAVTEFEGMFGDEVTVYLPTHKLQIKEFKPQLQDLVSHFNIRYNVDDITNTANEMELFTLVIREFRSIFSKGQTMKRFLVYDALEPGAEHWGMKGPNMALKKEANWIPFLKIKPKQDPWQQKTMSHLKQKKHIDEILRLHAQFFEVSDPNRVMDALRQHAVVVHKPFTGQLQPSYHSGQHANHIWNQIYGNADLYREQRHEDDSSPVEIDEGEMDKLHTKKWMGSAFSSKKCKNQGYSYSYTKTMQQLGLDEGDEESTKDPVKTQGAYLSLLFLRHLRIGELQRVCLGILNYFRSIERTLTINTSGLTINAGKLIRTAADTCWINAVKGGSATSDGLGSHHYLHNTPGDYKACVGAFMEFSEIENLDDFYTMQESYIHTQDQRGLYIMYDVALQDVKELEMQLLLLATQYIEKGKGCGTHQRLPFVERLQPGNVDLPSWAHISVDRFAVLLDLWNCEAAYLENKRQLLDSYFEAYQHVWDLEERFALAQVITDIMHKRPRFDLSDEYFVKAYQAECTCLKLHFQLIRDILNKQIDERREYLKRIWRDGQMEKVSEFGLPLNVITKQPVAINNSCPALKRIYLLEFHPSLALASRIPKALDHACWELYHIHQPKVANESISLEKQVLQLALEQWTNMEPPEASYNLQVQKDLFSGVFIEDPFFVRGVGISAMEAADEDEKTQGGERQALMLNTLCRLLEIITLRHRLIEVSSETALLARVYKSVSVEMGFEEFHLYLRPVQFEFATHKEKADQPPPVFITALLEDDSNVDRYIPSSLQLGIQEVDESQIGKFSFRSREAVLQLMARAGVDNVQVALACQTVQKHSLIAAVQQALFCPVEQAIHSTEPKEGMSSFQSLDNWEIVSRSGTVRDVQLGVFSLGGRKQRPGTRKQFGRPPEAFVSIQLEKVGLRDTMLNSFVTMKSGMGNLMKIPAEVEKIKRKLILDYCYKFSSRMSHYSIRGQIVAYYNSLLGLLEDFPTVRNTYFSIGQPQEKKGERDSELGLTADPRKLQQRCRSLLSADGKTFLNLWFIPHHSEVLITFKTLQEKVCHKALYQSLEIVAGLHDIVSYLCCFARLGNLSAIPNPLKVQPLAAEWGGLEGIGSELREIQAQIDCLPNPRDPAAVAKLLSLKRDVMFFQFDTSVRHSIREAFLTSGQVAAFQAVTDGMYHGLPAMSNAVCSSVYGLLLPLPQPLNPHSDRARALFPWRTFLAREGLFPVMISGLHNIESNMQMCLCGLSDLERSVANAELLGISLLIEELFQSGKETSNYPEKDQKLCERPVSDNEQKESVTVEEESRKPSPVSSTMTSPKTLPKSVDPISTYSACKSFLILWKQLEVFKEEWGRQKLVVDSINSAHLYKQFCRMYRVEILYPTMKAIGRRFGAEDEYERLLMDNQPLLPPKGASEVEIKTLQLHKILESMECHMIYELQKKIAKEMNLVMSERAREDATLPTDLWKRSGMKECFSVVRPQIVENFVQKLMEHSQESHEEIIFNKDHLRDCLMNLAGEVMARERSNFETYSMCYENILRQEHQLLYQKEQETKRMKTSSTPSGGADCQLADLSHEMIIEITALRAKLTSLEKESTQLKKEIRKEVNQEYDALVRHLFASCFALKVNLDKYHINMNKTVYELISDVRREGVENMITLKKKVGSTKEDDTLKGNLARQEQLQCLRDENSRLEHLVCKLKIINRWRQTVKQEQFQRSWSSLEQEIIKTKKDYLNIKMFAEEEVILLRQQLEAVRKALAKSQAECERVKEELDKEKWLLKEYQHRTSQDLRSRQQLDNMKAFDMERLLVDMTEKEQQLRLFTDHFERSTKIDQIQHSKINKEIKQIRSQLSHERNLKLDAFQRLDELQSQVDDFEAIVRQKSCASGTQFPINTSSLISRNYYQSPLTAGLKTSHVNWISNRLEGRIQRPKTVPSRLRSNTVELPVPGQEEQIPQTLLLQLLELRMNQK